ncbi:STE20-related kinase adapter protein alpha [Eumeta japonica]|uniref:STE20-related kinase adapter protein alpha n=1 Tax=Eumeta variegata TaxID=151549 RepID=A0A4C1YPX6_EUMVA|nr:STE20-related kinase adapter protein alpha [Eumeta japonica]
MCRGIRASHVLTDAGGGVRVCGLRSAAPLQTRGRRQRRLHDLPPPNHDNSNLIWLSPELLEQYRLLCSMGAGGSLYPQGPGLQPKKPLSRSASAVASKEGIGAILKQTQQDGKKPISYFSKKLIVAQKQKKVISLKCLAIKEANLKGYDERSDLYSTGVLACELANGAIPFSDVPTTLMFTEKVRGNRPQILDATTFSSSLVDADEDALASTKGLYGPDEERVGDGGSATAHAERAFALRTFSDHFHHFTELCLNKDPEKRPPASQLLSHSFFKQIRKSDFLPSLIGRVRPIKPQPGNL